jgi:DNA-binding CsgD family transcriptional regulator
VFFRICRRWKRCGPTWCWRRFRWPTLEALRLGVRALLPRDATEREVLAAIDAAAAGLALIDPRDLDQLLAAAPVARAADSSGVLTPREREVLAIMAEGDANKAIAWKLQISEHTAKFHVASILAKLNAGSRTEAVAVWGSQGTGDAVGGRSRNAILVAALGGTEMDDGAVDVRGDAGGR